MKEIDAQGFDSDHFDIKVELKSDKYKVGLAGEIKEQDGKINIAKGEH